MLVFSCFKQFASGFASILALSINIIPVHRLLQDVDGGLIISSDDPLDFHVVTLLVTVTILNI